MTLSTEVTLPKTTDPVFPRWCIRCAVEGPTETVRWRLGLGRRRTVVDVPCCASCRTSIQRERWLRGTITAVAAIVAGYLATFAVDDLSRGLQKWAAIGLALVAISPLLAWQVLVPRVVDILAHADTVDYEFKDRLYALEFARLNGTAVNDDY